MAAALERVGYEHRSDGEQAKAGQRIEHQSALCAASINDGSSFFTLLTLVLTG